MTDQEYIRKAVELADGWEVKPAEPNREGFWALELGFAPGIGWFDLARISQATKDALAAQLVRQVHKTEKYYVVQNRTHTGTYKKTAHDDQPIAVEWGKEETMNTIKAIVDSTVLDRE